MNIMMKDASVCVCPFCHLMSVLIADVFVCDCDPASLPHYVSSQHSRSPRRERERERCCHVRTLWPEQLLTNTISLPYLTSSASVCIPLSLSLSVVVCLALSLSFSFLPCVFLSPLRETFHRTWILAAAVLFDPLWRESVFDLGISKCFVSDVH